MFTFSFRIDEICFFSQKLIIILIIQVFLVFTALSLKINKIDS